MKWLALFSLAATLTFAANAPVLRLDTVEDSQIVHKVAPPYPGDAQDRHISGVVKLTVLIGTDGHVQQVKLVSGHPLLAPAAMHAVRQWVFKPFLQNGAPARALAHVEVPFTLPN
jgi:periplasmic protein TonB